jgi:hypothetical protein
MITVLKNRTGFARKSASSASINARWFFFFASNRSNPAKA